MANDGIRKEAAELTLGANSKENGAQILTALQARNDGGGASIVNNTVAIGMVASRHKLGNNLEFGVTRREAMRGSGGANLGQEVKGGDAWAKAAIALEGNVRRGVMDGLQLENNVDENEADETGLAMVGKVVRGKGLLGLSVARAQAGRAIGRLKANAQKAINISAAIMSIGKGRIREVQGDERDHLIDKALDEAPVDAG